MKYLKYLGSLKPLYEFIILCFFSSILCTCEDIPFFLSGETGIGKSTLIDTLFNTNFEDQESSHFCPHVRLKAQTYELQESNVRLKLTIVNTVGFGDQINKEERYMFSCNKTLFFKFRTFAFLPYELWFDTLLWKSIS